MVAETPEEKSAWLNEFKNYISAEVCVVCVFVFFGTLSYDL
jgi:hypothetical protein